MYIPHSYIINNICKLNISQQKRILGLLCLFFFFPLGIASKFLWVNTIVYYFFTERVNVFAGLNAGMLCSGMIIVVFLEMLRAVF